MKKTRYTLEQHESLGQELQLMRDRLTKIVTELSHSYPAKIYSSASKSLHYLDALRCELDNQACKENFGSKEALNTYYRSHRDDYHRPQQPLTATQQPSDSDNK